MKTRIFIFFYIIILLFSLAACSSESEIGNETEPPTESLPCSHEFGSWNTGNKPTCTYDGFEVRLCLLCDEIFERAIPMTQHTPKETIYAPDCTHEGYTEGVCECGYSYRTNIVAPTGHTLSEEITAPTCDAPGFTEYTCVDCDFSYVGSYVAALGHSFEEVTTRPTILTPGSTTHTCACSFSYTDNYVYYSDILENSYVDGSEIVANGIDVSRWNHEVGANGEYLPLDWNAIKAQGIDFVILKAGSTKSGIEPTFAMDYEGARAAGLEIGVYYYTYSTTIEGIRADAEALMGYLEGKQFEYPIYLDLEDSSLESLGKNYLSDMCEAFIVTLQENGYYAALYSNHNWLTYILDSAKIFSLYDVWYARYPLTDKPVWNEEKYGKQLGMWQYSESGTLEGFSCKFDMNYAYKDYSEIMKQWGFNGF